VLDLLNHTVTCPGGESTDRFQREKDGGKLFSFGARCGSCPLRPHCTMAAGGRSVSVHPQEELLLAARAYQETAEGRAHLRERVVAEHRLARLGQLGMGQARYCGRAKTRCQLLLLSTIANLRRTWNWVQEQAGIEGTPGREPVPVAA
jgi:Transposase DDE domain